MVRVTEPQKYLSFRHRAIREDITQAQRDTESPGATKSQQKPHNNGPNVSQVDKIIFESLSTLVYAMEPSVEGLGHAGPLNNVETAKNK